MNSNNKTGIIVLAAGSSSRLGKPKQLLRYNDKSLVQHTADEAITAAGSPVVVVTGSDSKLVETELKDREVQLVYNPDWREGMGTSISAGLTELLSLHPELENVIISVCDQPYISSALFRELIEKSSSSTTTSPGKSIVASSYKGTKGVPVLFGKEHFDDLLVLTGKHGAKNLLFDFADDVEVVIFEKGAIDIDTSEDYNRLIN